MDPPPTPPAQLLLARAGEGHDRREPGHPAPGRTLVPRGGRAAAAAGVGRDGDDRPQVSAGLPVVRDVSRPRHLRRGARLQHPGRAPSRRARPGERVSRAARTMTLVLRRLPLLGMLLAAISAAVFALTQALPGDPAFIAAGGGDATPEMIAHTRERLGLDRPLWVQYALYMRNALAGDFGRSLVNRKPVIEDLAAF